ncbi:MAG: site-2 protease family protein [Planctomycetales bacterium]|nr:site-2 protease family protein [Planctomycetales bacterium]
MLHEPPRTQGDLNFSLAGIPVRIHPLFWVVGLLLGLRGTEGNPKMVLVWMLSVLFSILAHEMGHALAAKYYGFQPWITLHGFGGLASYNGEHLESRKRIAISFAGPAAGFLVAAIIVVVLVVTGHLASLSLSFHPVTHEPYMPIQVTPSGSYHWAPLDAFIIYMLYINIFWGLINLFPVQPLDGGQITREFLIERDPYGGMRKSLIVSIAASVGLVLFALVNQDTFLAIMFGYLGYSSYATLQSMGGHGNPW